MPDRRDLNERGRWPQPGSRPAAVRRRCNGIKLTREDESWHIDPFRHDRRQDGMRPVPAGRGRIQQIVARYGLASAGVKGARAVIAAGHRKEREQRDGPPLRKPALVGFASHSSDLGDFFNGQSAFSFHQKCLPLGIGQFVQRPQKRIAKVRVHGRGVWRADTGGVAFSIGRFVGSVWYATRRSALPSPMI